MDILSQLTYLYTHRWLIFLFLLLFYIFCFGIGALATQKEWTQHDTRRPTYLPFHQKMIRSFTSFCVLQFMLCRLVLFAALLLPAFLRIGWWYARSPRIHRSIPYGEQKLRQNLDVYIPRRNKNKKKKNVEKDTLETDTIEKEEEEDDDELLPVLFFTGGGAWVVGHKAFCALLGRIFMTMGVLVVSPDYRQFPQVEVSDMLHDIDSAIQWTFDYCKEYGGDPKRVFIAGQSAGAHLTSTLVLEHASSELKIRRAAAASTFVSQGGSGGGGGSGGEIFSSSLSRVASIKKFSAMNNDVETYIQTRAEDYEQMMSNTFNQKTSMGTPPVSRPPKEEDDDDNDSGDGGGGDGGDNPFGSSSSNPFASSSDMFDKTFSN